MWKAAGGFLLLLTACFSRSSCKLRPCPTLATQVGDPTSLNITQFRAYLDIRDIPGLNDTATLDGQINVITDGEVSTSFASLANISHGLILPANLSLFPLHMQLSDMARQEIFYLFNVWSLGNTTAPPGCPTKEGVLMPGEDFENNVYLSCEGDGEVIVQACITIGSAPFDTLNGTYKTFEFYFLQSCKEPTSSRCNVTDQSEFVPGEVCITLNQSRALVNNPEGNWNVLLAAVAGSPDIRGYCVITSLVETDMGLAMFVADPSLRPQFPIAEVFTELDMYVGLALGTEALSYSMEFSSSNTSVLQSPSVLPKEQDIVYGYTDFVLNFTCYQPGFVEVPAVVNLSSVMDSVLYFQSYSFSIFKNCTPDDSGANSTMPGRSQQNSLLAALLGGLISALLFLAITVAVIVVMVLLTRRIFRKEKFTIQQLAETDALSSNNAYMMKTVKTPYDCLNKYNIEYNYPGLEVVGELGQGAFGRVFKARASGLKRDNLTPEFVAVKLLKDNDKSEAFCKEVKAVVHFNHPNIVRLLAISTTSPQKCMIFEYMDLGSLDDLLRKSDPNNETVDAEERASAVSITPSDFLQCSVQVAQGVAYLAEQKYVHRDIASRNCLVDRNFVVKIGDFGLSRELSSMDYYRVGGTQAYLPIRWMPPEALLFGKFTTQSDVWSFGILMWEIYTFGHQPYTGLSNHEVIDTIKSSRILECPKLCPASVYAAMKLCWTRSPAKRPNMPVIVQRLQRLQPKERDEGEGAADGCVCYVNMEYGAHVEQEELEESARLEQELSKDTHQAAVATEHVPAVTTEDSLTTEADTTVTIEVNSGTNTSNEPLATPSLLSQDNFKTSVDISHSTQREQNASHDEETPDKCHTVTDENEAEYNLKKENEVVLIVNTNTDCSQELNT